MMADWFKSFLYIQKFLAQTPPLNGNCPCSDQNHSQIMHLLSMQPPENQRGQYKS
jgi:hypothetical protein